MNKTLAAPIFLISTGTFLETYYYSFRFTNDNIPLWLSIVIGAGLTGLLIIATYHRKKLIAWILIIFLIVYSVFSTSAGQAFSLAVGQQQKTIKINNAQIEKLEDEKTRKQGRYNKITDMLNQSIETFDDVWEWKNTTAKYEVELKSLDIGISDIENSIRNMMNPTIEDDETNIYVFYSKLFGWNRKWLQFWLQTILSVFIAIMAPFGIIILPVTKKRRTRIIDWKQYVTKWVQYNWTGMRTGRSDHILNKKVFMDYARSKGDRFNDIIYRTILKAALQTKSVDKGNEICHTEQEAIDKIYKEMNNGRKNRTDKS